MASSIDDGNKRNLASSSQKHGSKEAGDWETVSKKTTAPRKTKVSTRAAKSLIQVRLELDSEDELAATPSADAKRHASPEDGSNNSSKRKRLFLSIETSKRLMPSRENTPKGWIQVGDKGSHVGTDSRFGRARLLGADVLQCGWFDVFISAIILMNCITIGIELQEPEPSRMVGILEDVFLGIYIMELGFRAFVLGALCLEDNLVRFDAFLVVSGVVSQWIFSEDYVGPGPVLNLLRTMRIVRLARTLNLLNHFQGLGMMVRGMLKSGAMMCYTFALLFLMIYMFACIGVEVVGKHSLAVGADADPDFQVVSDRHFASTTSAMLTLVQFVCLDDISTIYEPLIRISPVLTIYFMLLILVVGIVLMNLILGVIVNTAIDLAKDDHAYLEQQESKRRKKVIRELRQVFVRLDEDDSGQITFDELSSLELEDRRKLARVLDRVDLDLDEIFSALDVDSSGVVDIDEFCDGIWQVSISNVPIETKRAEKTMNYIREELKDISQRQTAFMERQVLHTQALWEVRSLLEAGGQPPVDLPTTTPPVATAWVERRSHCQWLSSKPQLLQPSEAAVGDASTEAVGLLLRLEQHLAEFRLSEALKLPDAVKDHMPLFDAGHGFKPSVMVATSTSGTRAASSTSGHSVSWSVSLDVDAAAKNRLSDCNIPSRSPDQSQGPLSHV